MPIRILVTLAVLAVALPAYAQTARVGGSVRDDTGAVLPGVLVLLRAGASVDLETETDSQGAYRFDAAPSGRVQLSFSLPNFGSSRHDATVPPGGNVRVDAVLHLSLSASVAVTGKRTFTNLADAENPAENLVGIAQSASQGAITARQLDTRPVMRAGEVLETVPGLIISQHSGEGKANQYYLRGFNLDHGTDFATTVAGMPVNMPTPRPRARLLGPQLPDTRARERRAVLEGAVLRRPGRLHDRRARRTSTT